MKHLICSLLLVVVGFTANAQQKRDLVLNDKTELIDAVIYHDNGQVAQKGSYTQDGKLHGTWISYNAAGEKTAVAEYSNGLKTGVWLFYQGDTLKEVTYSNNAITQVNTWAMQDTRVVSND
ncbi:toxin-antitoxin system YwqK family antitoxin [Gilvibacter sp.]|jgi:antitoxin component YwqK of YwqJK toxin-antitoxin module|uniref:toxin-antitoxin system YwqK family antitoxin n=1 Tax=Gilvibacter sp. TaxID=2729997 RepID=UPI0035BE78D9